MTKCKKGGKYDKGLFVGIKESENYQEKEIEKFVEEPTFDSSDSARFVEEHDDNGLVLIVNQAFFTLKRQDKDKWLRKKECCVVIDSCSCKNVISEETVTKLSLKMKPYQTSYKLTRLKKGIK